MNTIRPNVKSADRVYWILQRTSVDSSSVVSIIPSSMSAFQHLTGYSYPSTGTAGLAPTQLLLPSTTPTTSSSTACCESGRPVMTDPLTGQTVCSCQYTPALMSAYPRLASLPESVYSSYAAQGLVPLGADPSAFYSALGAPYELKDGADALRSLAQPGPYYTYDPSLAGYPYGYGMDLNSASRRKNATRENTNTLKAWLYEHRKNPYPTKGEKIMLAIITKMTLTQVSTWFANARRRLKKENKMTWSPKNKGEDDDDDDEDKGQNGLNQTSSDGEMRDNERDTDSIGGMAVDSDDEIIDAGMECDSMPHHLLPPRLSLGVLRPPLARPDIGSDDQDDLVTSDADTRGARPLSPTSPISRPSHSSPSGVPSGAALSGKPRPDSPTSCRRPLGGDAAQSDSESEEKEEELIVCDEGDTNPQTKPSSDSEQTCNNNKVFTPQPREAPNVLSISSSSGSTPVTVLSPPRTFSMARLSQGSSGRDSDPRDIRDAARRCSSPNDRITGPQVSMTVTSTNTTPSGEQKNTPSSTSSSTVGSSNGSSSTSESATTPKPRIWSLADVATSTSPHHNNRRTPPPGLPIHLSHKPHLGTAVAAAAAAAAAAAGPYGPHLNGFRLPWVSVNGAFINHPAAAHSGHPQHPSGLPHPYVLAPHAMLPRTMPSSGVLAPTPTHGAPHLPADTATRPHPYARPGSLPPPPHPPPPPVRPPGTAPPAPPQQPPPPPPPTQVAQPTSSPSTTQEQRTIGNLHSPVARPVSQHNSDKLKDGLESKRFTGVGNSIMSKMSPPKRDYEDTAFKPVSKRNKRLSRGFRQR